MAIFVNDDHTVYFDSFGVEHLPQEVGHFLREKETEANVFRVQPAKSVLCGYYCRKFLDYMFDRKSLVDYTSLFSPTDFKMNDRVVLRLFDIR